MVERVIRRCVAGGRGRGGFITYMLDRTLNAFVNFQFAPRVTIVPFLSITVHGPDANINPGDSDPTAPFAVRHSLGMRLGGRSNTGRCYGLSPPSSAAQADEKNKNSKGYGLKSTCEPALGSPSVANCLAAAGEFHQTGPLELKATDDPIIKIAGNCAIAIGFKAKTLTSWDLLNAVIYSLLEQCLDNPVAPRVGGITIPAPHAASNGGKIRKRSVPTLADGMEVAIYFQDPFHARGRLYQAIKAFSVIN